MARRIKRDLLTGLVGLLASYAINFCIHTYEAVQVEKKIPEARQWLADAKELTTRLLDEYHEAYGIGDMDMNDEAQWNLYAKGSAAFMQESRIGIHVRGLQRDAEKHREKALYFFCPWMVWRV